MNEMVIMDEYTLQILDNTGYNYLKNGLLHREIGPAVFTIYTKEFTQLLNLDDKELYKEEKISSNPDYNPVMFGPNQYYYLEGVRYSEDDFSHYGFKN